MAARQRRERERAELRQQILAAARQLASQEGWQAVTVRKVAERIEYSHAAIYAYFDNKEAILLALLREGFQLVRAEMQAAQNIAGTPEDRLQRMALAYWHFACTNPELYQVMHGLDGVPFGTAQTPIEAKEAFAQLRTGVVHVLAQFVDLTHIDVDSEVDLLWATLHGLISLAMARRLAGDQQRAAQLIISAVEHFLAAWRTMFRSC
jgi:AcrR family transcriptional regulator